MGAKRAKPSKFYKCQLQYPSLVTSRLHPVKKSPLTLATIPADLAQADRPRRERVFDAIVEEFRTRELIPPEGAVAAELIPPAPGPPIPPPAPVPAPAAQADLEDIKRRLQTLEMQASGSVEVEELKTEVSKLRATVTSLRNELGQATLDLDEAKKSLADFQKKTQTDLPPLQREINNNQGKVDTIAISFTAISPYS